VTYTQFFRVLMRNQKKTITDCQIIKFKLHLKLFVRVIETVEVSDLLQIIPTPKCLQMYGKDIGAESEGFVIAMKYYYVDFFS